MLFSNFVDQKLISDACFIAAVTVIFIATYRNEDTVKTNSNLNLFIWL